MRTRRLGRLEVTTIGLGCAGFGGKVDLAAARGIVDAAIDSGITLLDTADRYGDPVTSGETILGEALRGRRDEVVLATKFGRVLDDERQGARPEYVRSATEASLRRLQTDHIDLLQLHIPDPETPIEDTLGALAELVQEGKVLEIGGSNFSTAELEEMTSSAAEHDLPAFASVQAPYSILDRGVEEDLLPALRREGITLLPYWPLFNGLLSGRFGPGRSAPEGSTIAGKSDARRAEILSDRNLSVVDALTGFAEERGHTLLELAFAWLLAHPEVPSVIAGASSAEQIRTNAAAGDWSLTTEELAAVDALAPAAPVSASTPN